MVRCGVVGWCMVVWCVVWYGVCGVVWCGARLWVVETYYTAELQQLSTAPKPFLTLPELIR